MTKYLLKHAFQYILVSLVLTTAIISLFLIENSHIRRTVIFGVASLYPLWGIAHHLEEKNLTAEVLLEYLAFTMLMLWTLLVVI